jgi:hypothetical protein
MGEVIYHPEPRIYVENGKVLLEMWGEVVKSWDEAEYQHGGEIYMEIQAECSRQLKARGCDPKAPLPRRP